MIGAKFGRGFTLIELVMTIVVIGVLATVVGPLIYKAATSAHIIYDQQGLNSQGRVALALMSKDIRNLSVNDVSHLTLGANSITVTDLSGDTAHYSLSGTDLMRTENGTASVLATQASSLSFSYFDIDGAVTASLSAVRYVRIEFTLSEGGHSATFRTTVFLRNAR